MCIRHAFVRVHATDSPALVKRFTIDELARLTGKLGRAAQMYRPLYHVMGQLYPSMASALAGNGAYLFGKSQSYRDLFKKDPSSGS